MYSFALLDRGRRTPRARRRSRSGGEPSAPARAVGAARHGRDAARAGARSRRRSAPARRRRPRRVARRRARGRPPSSCARAGCRRRLTTSANVEHRVGQVEVVRQRGRAASRSGAPRRSRRTRPRRRRSAAGPGSVDRAALGAAGARARRTGSGAVERLDPCRRVSSVHVAAVGAEHRPPGASRGTSSAPTSRRPRRTRAGTRTARRRSWRTPRPACRSRRRSSR